MMTLHKQQTSKRKRTREDVFVDSLIYFITFIILVLVLYPLVYVLSASISEPRLVTTGKLILLPKQITFEGYEKILEYKPIWIGYRNTIFYTTVGTLINIFGTVTCAYVLSRKDFRPRKFFSVIFMFTMFFNGGLVPTYLVVKQIGILNTVWSMWLPVAISVYNVMICRTYFENSIPYEIQEAAFIDGCSDIQSLATIVLPLSKPIIAVLGLFYAVSYWNSYFNALIYLSDVKLYPLQLYLRSILILDQMSEMLGADAEMIEQLIRRMELKESMKYGIIVLSSLPIILIYPFLQRYFVKGLMIGAVKG